MISNPFLSDNSEAKNTGLHEGGFLKEIGWEGEKRMQKVGAGSWQSELTDLKPVFRSRIA